MNEAEFRAHAEAEGFREPESRIQPANRFFDTHAHEDDLMVLVTEGTVTVDYGDRQETFGPGDMCQVAPGIEHTDAVGAEGASFILAWRTPASAARQLPNLPTPPIYRGNRRLLAITFGSTASARSTQSHRAGRVSRGSIRSWIDRDSARGTAE